MKYAKQLKTKLNKIISGMESNSESFVRNPKRDFTRKRKLDFTTIIKMIIGMGGDSLSKEIIEFFNYNEGVVTTSAFVQQREKILPLAFEYLLKEFNKCVKSSSLHKGYRLIAVDGTDLSVYANPEDKENYFKIKNTEKAYGLLHLNALYDLSNKIYIDTVIQNRKNFNEHRALIDMVKRYKSSERAIFICDRGYESYNVFCNIEQNNHKYVIRIKDIHSNGIASNLNLPNESFDLEFQKLLTRQQTKKIKENENLYKFMPTNSVFDFLEPKSKLTYDFRFRLVRFKISDDNYELLITNLTKDEFSLENLKELYHSRWGIEVSFRELKYSIGMANFHSKKSELIYQEIYAKILMYNFSALVISKIEIPQNKTYTYQVNFNVAVSICINFYKTTKHKQHPNIEVLIKKFILPIRPNRSYKRNVKVKSFKGFNYRIS